MTIAHTVYGLSDFLTKTSGVNLQGTSGMPLEAPRIASPASYRGTQGFYPPVLLRRLKWLLRAPIGDDDQDDDHYLPRPTPRSS
jgi:hypothetical protein